jgi:rare lipoprotein A
MMRRRHRILVAATMLAPACAPTAAHRSTSSAPPPTAGPRPVDQGAAAARPDEEAATSPAGPSTTTTEVAPTTTVTVTVPTTTTHTHAPVTSTFVLPEAAEDDLSDEEWAEHQRGQVARVSWYGSESGTHTANGDRYDPSGLTFAHRTMAFGTVVRFCGPLGCVVATCTDRGPAAWTGKTFDLSQAAFARVAPLSAGVTDVTWEVIGS